MLKTSLSPNYKPDLSDSDTSNDKMKNDTAEVSKTTGKNNSKSTSRLTTPVDEDWSIISSSSDLDIDDERSTTSSQDYPQLIINDSTDLSILKVPEQHVPQTSLKTGTTTHQNEEGNPNLETSQTTISTPSDSDLEMESDSNSILSGGSSNNNNDNSLNVGSKIRFFENLTQLNDSIKQKSNQFYYDFAKIHLDNYIDDQQHRQEELTNEETKEGEIEENLDDTIELVSNIESIPSENGVIDSSLSTIKDSQVGDLILKHNDNNNNTIVARKSKPVLVRAVQNLQIFLDNHSDYLYYYMMAAMVVGIIPVIYSIKYVLVPKQVVEKPLTAFDKLNQMWDHLLYEEEQEVITKRSIFFIGSGGSTTTGKHKTNKLIKFINTLQYNFYDRALPQYYVMVDKMNFYGNRFWKQSQDLGAESLIKLKLWGDQSVVILNKYSVIGLRKFDYYSQVGLDNFIKYRELSLDNLQRFYSRAGFLGKRYGHNVIVGSKCILKDITHQSQQLKTFMEEVFNSDSYDDLKENTHQQWTHLISTYNFNAAAAVSTASKFKSRLDKNAVQIYKFGKNLADSIKNELAGS